MQEQQRFTASGFYDARAVTGPDEFNLRAEQFYSVA
jgi:hypothetical protein